MSDSFPVSRAICSGIVIRARVIFLILATSLIVQAQESEQALLLNLQDEWDHRVWLGVEGNPGRMISKHYVYVEPDSVVANHETPRLVSMKQRLEKEAAVGDGEPLVQIVGDTAIVTGNYRLRERCSNKETGTPRFVAQGRFTTTWVRDESNGWLLLAEHRSLNDMQDWTVVAVKPIEILDVTIAEESLKKPDPEPPSEPLKKENAAEESETELNKAYVRRLQRGFLPTDLRRVFGAYEPTRIGLTNDQGDERFLDFTISPMIALDPGAARYPNPDRSRRDQGFWKDRSNYKWNWPNFYFAATVRAGQYMKIRPSSPVVGKRFNPLIAVRWWARDEFGAKESLNNYVEFVVAHESNGQSIASRSSFDQQLQTFLNLEGDSTSINDPAVKDTEAYTATRDYISRSWDYVGVNFSRDGDGTFPKWFPLLKNTEATYGLLGRYHHYIDSGIIAGKVEEYGSYKNVVNSLAPEFDPAGKPRNYTDGLSLRFSLELAPRKKAGRFLDPVIRLERRYVLTWTTGGARPFNYNTFTAEATATLFNLMPFSVWYRWGYNSDFIDYYVKDESIGFAFNYWEF